MSHEGHRFQRRRKRIGAGQAACRRAGAQMGGRCSGSADHRGRGRSHENSSSRATFTPSAPRPSASSRPPIRRVPAPLPFASTYGWTSVPRAATSTTGGRRRAQRGQVGGAWSCNAVVAISSSTATLSSLSAPATSPRAAASSTAVHADATPQAPLVADVRRGQRARPPGRGPCSVRPRESPPAGGGG